MRAPLYLMLTFLLAAPALSQASDGIPLAPGDRVWTDDGWAGRVNGTFGDGRVSVRIGYDNATYTRDHLAAEGCVEQLCSGAPVATSDGWSGHVNGFFPDSSVSVQIGNDVAHYTLSDLAY